MSWRDDYRQGSFRGVGFRTAEHELSGGRRAPIADWTLLGNPLRYVLEGAHTEFLGEQRGALGFTGLTSLGVGLELDSSKYPVFITRTRLVARYMFGNNTTGYGVGLAMSF